MSDNTLKIPQIGKILVSIGAINEQQLLQALAIQQQTKEKLGEILMRLGYLTEDNLYKALSIQFNLPLIRLTKEEVKTEALKFISFEEITKYKLIPFSREGNVLKLATWSPSEMLFDIVKFFFPGFSTQLFIIKKSDAIAILTEFFAKEEVANYEEITSIIEALKEDFKEESSTQDVVTVTVDSPVVKLVNKILADAVTLKASDIHIQPEEKNTKVRYRVDGMLHLSATLPVAITPALITRIKVMAGMDITERRLPQDGRIKTVIEGKNVDLRVSSLPSLYGEKIVIRVLDKTSFTLSIKSLGLEPEELDMLIQCIKKPYGIILVTGPTGSGKTTTLYSILNELNSPTVNILTVEDPIEYELEGITQVQTKEEIGLTFASALRAFLRQDPDIIMVGEIRDYDTAEIATKAALTGHLVLSTLHTNDASSTVIRLINMGIEPFIISSTLIAVIAQRLVRTLCPKCKQPDPTSFDVLKSLGDIAFKYRTATFYKPVGCSFCNNTGYKGRTGLFEIMVATDEIKKLILAGALPEELNKMAVKQGMLTLREYGLKIAAKGITSLSEVLRVTV